MQNLLFLFQCLN